MRPDEKLMLKLRALTGDVVLGEEPDGYGAIEVTLTRGDVRVIRAYTSPRTMEPEITRDDLHYLADLKRAA